jgi:putative ABC transport system permease protein
MRNPLNKRWKRELKEDFGKYLVIFLFLAGTIAFVSGFLVASDSMIYSYDESFEKYQIEDGNFELSEKADQSLIDSLEKEAAVTIYENFYVEEETKEVDSTLRIFKNRSDEIDGVCIMDGEIPTKKNEIAINF